MDDNQVVALWGLAREREEIEKPGFAKKWIRRLLPYIGTAAIFIYLYYNLKEQFSSDAFFNALKQADLALLALGIFIPFVIFIGFNLIMTSLIYTWFVTPLKIRDIWSVRGATLLVGSINPTLAGGAWMVYLMRKTGAPFLRILAMGGLGFVAVLSWIHLLLTILLIMMVTGHYGEEVTEGLVRGLTIYVIFGWLLFFQTISFWLMGWKWGPLNRVREWRIMEMLHRADLRQWLIITFMVLPSILAAFLGQWICALSFGIEMPFHVFTAKFFKAIPYLFIPSVAHVGPLTAGWLEAYKGMATPETITACTLAIITAGHLVRISFGLVSIIPATREIARLADQETKERSE
ncbi:MAG: hypothetical protein JRJ85_27320 [Deltaproteobacteria bacterium]|nr:hypothetical protein [Deltaproteobacteria bacterium]